MGFTKLDENILQSSIMAEDDATFKVWIALLAACKEDGVARVSPLFLASICRKEIDTIVAALKKLESPDEYSRSTNDNGKRIERIDGGYRIINYSKYRSFTYSDSKAAIKKRKQRGHEGDMSPNGGDISASASASDKKGDTRGKQEYSESFISFWAAYPRKEGKETAWKAWQKSKPDIKIVLDALQWQTKQVQWTRDDGQYIPHPSTYINGHRWDDRPIVVAAMEKPKFEFNKL